MSPPPSSTSAAYSLLSPRGSAAVVYRHKIIAGGRAIAIYTNTTNLTQQIRYLHYDVQGSVNAVTDASGVVVARMSFSAFGARRNPNDWQGPDPDVSNDRDQTHRGYTGHEQLDPVGLIHMNGRIYDPVVGRFTSADPFVQAPYFSQSLNRYSYVWNNPATLIDPSGFVIEITINCGIAAETGKSTCPKDDDGRSGGGRLSPSNGTTGGPSGFALTGGGSNYGGYGGGSGSSTVGPISNASNIAGYNRFHDPFFITNTTAGVAGLFSSIGAHNTVHAGLWKAKN